MCRAKFSDVDLLYQPELQVSARILLLEIVNQAVMVLRVKNKINGKA